MDHVPLPRDPVRSPPRIQYYCLEEYDRGDFNTYPERQGWTQEEIRTRSTWAEVDGAGGRGQRAAAAFLQQWLFFGLLHAAFGDDIVFQDFIDEERGTKYIHTRNLLPYAGQLLMKRDSGLVTENDMPRLDLSLRTACIAYGFISREIATPLDPYFLLSISLLGRFLVCLRRDLLLGNYPIPGMQGIMWQAPWIHTNDHTDLLQYEMIKQGWCPMAVDRINKFIGLEFRYFASFLSNLQKDQLHHRVCTRTQCLATQIQKSSYRTVHRSDGCGCPFQGFDQAAVEKVLEAGGLPLVTWDRNNKMVNLISGNFDATYVAISHVWSDGLGNPHSNTMPQCQLEVLNDLVQNIHPEKADEFPFWIDTLCCPAISSNGKRIAIRKMRDTYACANEVLVLDNALRSMNVTGRSIAELAFYIHSSNWSSRLWTFQEGALPEKLTFQFSNATLDCNEILFAAKRSVDNVTNGWVSGLDILGIYYCIRGRERHWKQPYKAPVMDLPQCSLALCTRTTSVQEDESLCLAGLMDLNIAPLLSANPQDRMMLFWAQLPHISEDWMYHQHSRLDSVGFRWAPKTLLGLGTGQFNHDARASPTKHGLLVNAYSITLWGLNIPLSHPIDGKVWIRGTDDQWGHYIAKSAKSSAAQGYEHFTVLDGHFSRIALLTTETISTSSLTPYTTFVMVFVTEEYNGVTYARRADSGTLFDVNHPAFQGNKLHTSQLSRREHFLQGTSDRVTREGENYLINNQYTAVVGDWTDKKSRWCID